MKDAKLRDCVDVRCLMYVCIKTEEVEEIKDLGVHYDTLLLFIIIFSLFWRIKLLACLLDKHVSENVKKAYSMLGIIKRHFAYILEIAL